MKKIDGYDTTYIEYKGYPLTGENKTVDIPVIKYKLFDNYKDIAYGFSTRLGGVSKEHLSSMNLSFTRGDNPDYVIENHKRFAYAVGYDYKKLVFSDQVHDVIIKNIYRDDIGKGIAKDSDIIGVDGLVTNICDIPLITFYADCVPLFFYDPIKKVIGLAHSGWKGTRGKIGTKMVDKMKVEYGSSPEDILCAIGPSICYECYEVDVDVANNFREVYSKEEYDDIVIPKNDGKFLLNLHKACKYNFTNAGIREENIAMADLCTCCNSDTLFSHRATKGMRGNLVAVIMLKNN